MKQTNLTFIITTSIYLFITPYINSTLAWEGGMQAPMKAHIQEKTSIRLIGYTGPNTIVQVEGIRVFGQVSSDPKGYFVIDPLPISYEASEICLTTVDAERRHSFPVCIQLPDTDKPSEVGPVYLAPTLSISSGAVLQKEKDTATGVTIPESKVIVSIFTSYNTNSMARIADKILAGLRIPVAEAADMPFITLTSDKRGFFSFNLPTELPSNYRFFVKAIYRNSPTPKSHTLAYHVDSLAMYWLLSVLPRLLLFIMFLGLLYHFVRRESKDRKIRLWLTEFTETRLKPFAVRRRLQLRRIWYNLRDYWRSNRI